MADGDQNQNQNGIDGGAQGDLSARPADLPEAFWDGEKKSLRTPEFVKAYNELATAKAANDAAFKDFPAEAGKAGDFYKLPEKMLPEGVKLPDGIEFKPNTELLGAALPILHKHKVSREAFEDLTRAFNAHQIDRHQAAAAEFIEDNKKLGANGDARRKAVGDALIAAVGDDAKFIDAKVLSSGAITFFEKLIAKLTSQSGHVPGQQKGNGNSNEDPSDEEWAKMSESARINYARNSRAAA